MSDNEYGTYKEGDFNQDKPISAKDKLKKIRRRRLEEMLEDIRLREELDDYHYYSNRDSEENNEV